MIDENTLDTWEKNILGKNIHFPRRGAIELIQLGRLGLWAEKHGIPIMQLIKENPGWEKACKYADDALAALSKDKN